MELIDIDPLKKRIDKEVKEGKVLDGWAFFFKAYLDSEPTIDIDRPQGEWIVDISDYKSMCSVCGANETHFIYGTEMWYGLGKSNFCPYCGADMREREDK